MYVSGLISDFASRLHCLPTGLSDLTTGFILEASGYLASSGLINNVLTPSGLVNIGLSGQWEFEARRQYTQLSAVSSGMLIQQTVG